MAKKIQKKGEGAALPKEGDFQNQQLDLFRSFLYNTDGERDRLSNTFDLWDSVPRYSVSRQAMDKMRKSGEFSQLMSVPFNYRGSELVAIIQPAWVQNDDKTVTGYYPSANEELIEDALRKIAAEQNYGYFDKPNYRSGVVFSLHLLREELKKRGHSRSYQQIYLSLKILARSSIEITNQDGKEGEGMTISSYFPKLTAVSRKKLAEDPDSKWMVEFHPLVTRSIDTLTYRQFNYAQMMSHKTQLARWIHKQLSLKFTFASLSTSFEMRFSTIKRDSALLEGYKQQRQAVAALDEAFEELKSCNVLAHISKNEIRGARSKLEDVVYTLNASLDFASQMKAANKRQNLIEDKKTLADNASSEKGR